MFLMLSIVGCAAVARDDAVEVFPGWANDPKRMNAAIDRGVYNCLAWPIRAGNRGEEGDSELVYKSSGLEADALGPTPLPPGFVPVGAITMKGNAAVVACLPPTAK